MDGIVNSLTSIIPILPENNMIATKNGPNGPPVEVMPLPQNSFLSDQTTAEFLNNPYTLSYDLEGQNGGLLDGLLPDEAAPGGAGESAYKLSLGTPDDADVPPMVAFEMSRARSYEELGMLSSRRLVRPGRDLGPSMPADDTGTGALTPLPRSSAFIQLPLETELQAQTINYGTLPFTILEDTAEYTPSPISRAPMTLGEGVSVSEEVPQGALRNAPTPVIVDGSESSPALTRLADRLSVSDFQAVMELEPDLRDAFIRMISQDDESAPRITLDVPYEAPRAEKGVPAREAPPNGTAVGVSRTEAGQTVVPGLNTADETLVTPFALPIENGDTAPPPKLPLPPLPLPPEAFPVRERTVMPNGTIIQQPPELIRYQAAMELPDLSAGVMAAAVAATEYKPPKESKNSNLKKTTELPYSLYLFGPIQGRPREDEEEEEDPPARKTTASPIEVSGYLKLSEAVRMAAVLHDIYRGGSGHFEEASPWYLPYVRYAVTHDMIKNGEFEDYNEFATRAQAAYIFSSSVPEAEFPVLNAVGNLYDVDEQTGYGGYIYRLLRAGVLMPADQGFFYPDQLMTRDEAVALVGRIATPTDRKHF